MAKIERVVIPAVTETRVIEEEKEVFKLELNRYEVGYLRSLMGVTGVTPGNIQLYKTLNSFNF